MGDIKKPQNFIFGKLSSDELKTFTFGTRQPTPSPSSTEVGPAKTSKEDVKEITNKKVTTSTTKVIEEKGYAIWKIEGISDDGKWEAIKAQGKCILELRGAEVDDGQPRKLCFFLQDDGNCAGTPGLYCKTVDKFQNDVVVRVGVDRYKLDGSSSVILSPKMMTLKTEWKVGGPALDSCCVLTGAEAAGLFPVRTGSNYSGIWTPPGWTSPPQEDLVEIGISAIMYSCKDSGDNQPEPPAQQDAMNHLARDLGKLYDDGNGAAFFPDLELESKDGIHLKTHKFIVAARSPPLKTRLEELEKETGNGVSVLKVPELNAQALMAILHWMYTGELSPLGSVVMGVVIKGAKTLQLEHLLKICDTKLVTLCTPENMFELYQVAKENDFKIAIKDISQFIKENV